MCNGLRPAATVTNGSIGATLVQDAGIERTMLCAS